MVLAQRECPSRCLPIEMSTRAWRRYPSRVLGSRPASSQESLGPPGLIAAVRNPPLCRAAQWSPIPRSTDFRLRVWGVGAARDLPKVRAELGGKPARLAQTPRNGWKDPGAPRITLGSDRTSHRRLDVRRPRESGRGSPPSRSRASRRRPPGMMRCAGSPARRGSSCSRAASCARCNRRAGVAARSRCSSSSTRRSSSRRRRPPPAGWPA